MRHYWVQVDDDGFICADCLLKSPPFDVDSDCEPFEMPDEVMPPPLFDMGENIVEAVERSKSFQKASFNPIPGHQIKGFLWTTRNKFKGTVWLDYSALNVRNCPSAKQAAEHAFSRAVMNKTLGADAKDLAGHILFVPVTPWGGPVMVK